MRKTTRLLLLILLLCILIPAQAGAMPLKDVPAIKGNISLNGAQTLTLEPMTPGVTFGAHEGYFRLSIAEPGVFTLRLGKGGSAVYMRMHDMPWTQGTFYDQNETPVSHYMMPGNYMMRLSRTGDEPVKIQTQFTPVKITHLFSGDRSAMPFVLTGATPRVENLHPLERNNTSNTDLPAYQVGHYYKIPNTGKNTLSFQLEVEDSWTTVYFYNVPPTLNTKEIAKITHGSNKQWFGLTGKASEVTDWKPISLDFEGDLYIKVQTSVTHEGKYSFNWSLRKGGTPSTLTIEPSGISLAVGKQWQFTAKITPNTGETVNWSIKDTAIATVNASGKVMAKKAGKTTLTASTKSGLSASVPVNVVNQSTLEIRPAQGRLLVGQQQHFYVVVSPSNDDKKVTWTIDDTSIATVNRAGTVTGVKAGETTLRAETESGIKASARITVLEKVELRIVPGEAKFAVGEQQAFYVTIDPANGDKKIHWEIDDQSIAKVSLSGVVTGLKAGKTTLRAETESGLTASAPIEITKKANATYRTLSLTTDIAGGKTADAAIMREALAKTQYKDAVTSKGNRTVKQMKNDIRLAFKDVKESDTSLLYISGKGDSAGNLVDKNGGKWKYTDIRKTLEGYPCKWVVIIDADYAGHFIGSKMDERFTVLVSATKTGKKVTRTFDKTVPAYDKQKFSMFTFRIREIMRNENGAPKDGKVTLSELYTKLNAYYSVMYKTTLPVYPKDGSATVFEIK